MYCPVANAARSLCIKKNTNESKIKEPKFLLLVKSSSHATGLSTSNEYNLIKWKFSDVITHTKDKGASEVRCPVSASAEILSNLISLEEAQVRGKKLYCKLAVLCRLLFE